MRRIRWLIGFLVLFVAGVLFGCSGASYANNRITPGVYVGNLNLGGMTREQAGEKLALMEDKLVRCPVVIKHEDNTWTMDAGLLGITLDSEKTLQKAVSIGHTGSIIEQWRERYQVKKEGRLIQPELSTDWSVLKKKIMTEVGQINAEPVDAGFRVTSDDQVEIVPAQNGSGIDFNTLAREIFELVIETTGNDEDNNGTAVDAVELPVVIAQPKRTTEDIEAMQINGRIARYTTWFDAGQEGRTYNIKVAASALDGVLLAPGEHFSFNRVVGPRSSEAGYKSANVIVNNELVQGLGGGVCQVSSTLYNAVLLANLKIIERSNHTLPVSYVPIGQDATVVYEAIDFRFANNKESYIYIKSQVEGNAITFKIYGNKKASPRVEVVSRVTETVPQKIIHENDPNLATGEQVVKQKGNNGFKVVTTRYIWENSEKTTEKLPESYYHTVNRIVAVGTGQVKPSVVVPPDNSIIPVSPNETDEPAQPVLDNTIPVDPGMPPVDGEYGDTGEEAVLGPVPELDMVADPDPAASLPDIVEDPDPAVDLPDIVADPEPVE